MIEISSIFEFESMNFLHDGFFEVDIGLIYVLGKVSHSLLLLMGTLRLELQLLHCCFLGERGLLHFLLG